MQNEIKIFDNAEFGQVRTLEEDGKILFSAKDIAVALGYSNPRDATSRHCKGVVKRDTLSNGGIQQINFIAESDVYRLIVSSKLPSAEKFERWVFDEVLPSIRQHGMYATPVTIESMISNPDFAIKLLTELKDEQEKRIRESVEHGGSY